VETTTGAGSAKRLVGGEVCVGQEHLAGSRGFAHLILILGTHPGALDLALSPKIHPLL
jgi:hypothetical protein